METLRDIPVEERKKAWAKIKLEHDEKGNKII